MKALIQTAGNTGLQPQGLPLGLLLGDLQQRLGQKAEAAATYTKLAADFPRDPRPLLALALLRQELGDSKGAQDALALARQRQPGSKDIRLDQVAASWGLNNLRRSPSATPTTAPSPETQAPTTARPDP